VRVLVLAGGESNEREVSLNSGGAVCAALKRLGHEVTALDPATGGRLLPAAPNGALQLDNSVHFDKGMPVRTAESMVSSLARARTDVDVVFIALHGGAGENGSIQNLLDLAGVKYTGSGMAASAVAMDKALTKHVMNSLAIPTPSWRPYRLSSGTDRSVVADDIANRFALPIIVKPSDGGSTIGLTKVESADQIQTALSKAAAESSAVLVEEFIAGRELTVAVFEGKSYPLVEIVPQSGLYDYEAKYTKGKSRYLAPAEVDPVIAEALSNAAARLYDAIGCRGLARVDFLVQKSSEWFCLEINTVPGLTSLSLAPMSLGLTGIDFDRLIEKMIEAALKP
jgi:D-alanine-D-alanine ligase